MYYRPTPYADGKAKPFPIRFTPSQRELLDRACTIITKTDQGLIRFFPKPKPGELVRAAALLVAAIVASEGCVNDGAGARRSGLEARIAHLLSVPAGQRLLAAADPDHGRELSADELADQGGTEIAPPADDENEEREQTERAEQTELDRLAAERGEIRDPKEFKLRATSRRAVTRRPAGARARTTAPSSGAKKRRRMKQATLPLPGIAKKTHKAPKGKPRRKLAAKRPAPKKPTTKAPSGRRRAKLLHAAGVRGKGARK